MVYPIRVPSSDLVRNAVFDYLNLNRHKFDQYGNFDRTPDERDYIPLQLARWNRAGPPRRTSEWDDWIQPRRQPEPQSASEFRMRELTTMTEEDEERREQHRQMAERDQLTPKKCVEEWQKELERCSDRWPGRSYTACKERAGYRLRECKRNRRYELKEWGWEDLGIPEIEKEEFRKRFGNPGAQRYEGEYSPGVDEAAGLARSETRDQDLNAWATSQLPRFSPPLVEGSHPEIPLGFEKLLALTPALSRAFRGMWATPGMGFAGGIGGGGGGGKRPLVPRSPGDLLFAPMKLY